MLGFWLGCGPVFDSCFFWADVFVGVGVCWVERGVASECVVKSMGVGPWCGGGVGVGAGEVQFVSVVDASGVGRGALVVVC